MKQQVTVFVGLCERLYDSDYGPLVYFGRLTFDQIHKIGMKLGCVGRKTPGSVGYANMAIEGCVEHGWYISYSNNPDVDPRQSELGQSFCDTEGCGDLSFHVEYRELDNPDD